MAILAAALGDILTALLIFGVLVALFFSCWQLYRTRNGEDKLLAARQTRAAPRCRSCGYDLRGATDLCPECGLPVLDTPRLDLKRMKNDWPANEIDPRSVYADEVPITVFVTSHPFEAAALQSQLGARGLFCELRHSTEGAAVSEIVDDGTPMHVVVWGDDVHTAKAYIESVTVRPEHEPPDAQPS